MRTSRVHLRISGRVQGVCFRMETQRQAEFLRVHGWVKNMHDGSVEAVFEGKEDRVREMIHWCEKGPPYSRVVKVESRWEAPRGEIGFQISYETNRGGRP